MQSHVYNGQTLGITFLEFALTNQLAKVTQRFGHLQRSLALENPTNLAIVLSQELLSSIFKLENYAWQLLGEVDTHLVPPEQNSCNNEGIADVNPLWVARNDLKGVNSSCNKQGIADVSCSKWRF